MKMKFDRNLDGSSGENQTNQNTDSEVACSDANHKNEGEKFYGRRESVTHRTKTFMSNLIKGLSNS
jgi:hypothetical protein